MMTNWIISSSVLIVLVMLVRLVFKEKMSQKLRYGLWLLVLIRLLVPFSLGESEISIDNFTESAVMSDGGNLITEIGKIDLPKMSYNDAYEQVASEYAGNGIDISQLPIAQYENVSYEIDNVRRSDVSIAEMVKYIWLGGIAVVGGCFVASNMIFASKLRKNRRPIVWQNNRLPIFVTDKVDTPCLFGIFRPTIYVTDETMADYTTLHHVVEHELTHFRHCDHIWSILRCACLAIHWYNPLVWATAVMSRNDAELACDEATIKRIGESERAEYGRTLIMMTCEKRPALFNTATTMTGSGRTIRERISLIVKKPKMAAYTLVIVAVIGIIAALVTFTGAKNDGQNFYEWTSSLTTDDIELVTVSKFFGLEQRRYTIPKEDYQGLVNIFNGIKAKDLSNDKPQSENKDGYMMALYRDEKLWLFKALADGSVGLMFEDAETGAIYDCEGSLLVIESETLWQFIKNTVDEKAELSSDLTIYERLSYITADDLKQISSNRLWPEKDELAKNLRLASQNVVEPPENMVGFWDLNVYLSGGPESYDTDDERLILHAGVPENYVHIMYYPEKAAYEDAEIFVLEHEGLYECIRKCYAWEGEIDESSLDKYYDVLKDRAEKSIVESNKSSDASPITGFDIVEFVLMDSFKGDVDAYYEVYKWDIAFYGDDPSNLNMMKGFMVDNNFRVRNHEKNTYFVVKTEGDTEEYRFMESRLYNNEAEVDEKIIAEFDENVRYQMVHLAYDEAINFSDKISPENVEVVNNGDGTYTLTFPVDEKSAVKVILRSNGPYAWNVHTAEIVTFSTSNDPISLAYEDALARMANLTAGDIKYISSNFDPPAEDKMASAMANAVKNSIGSEPDNGVYFWSADVYLSGGPSGYSSNDEHFNLYAGPTENIVAAWYKPEGDGNAVRLCFEDADLYWLIRDIYQTYVHLDRNALEPYRDIIEARAQKTIDESKNAVGVQPYTGFEIVRFDHIDEFERSGKSYNVYAWDVAFTSDDPVRAGFAGGMWVDNKLRIRSVDEEVYFIVRDDGEYRFMFWDLYTDVERAPIDIEKAFE
ncbi:MAG: M56 family metallopeptidase [Clostridia bacterium]|nr:M56 family metallopeptidase [Clostridia bacterium]